MNLEKAMKLFWRWGWIPFVLYFGTMAIKQGW
ncbi:hypothetical protein MNBD_DELTA01-1928 [hydrothermal vent metagenome]|uniref:Uncharacterized protein n=1 Tax=hydrothermal vent metagenome TaxID=652676 RepID=A0A3B0RL74_9ZZZZ